MSGDVARETRQADRVRLLLFRIGDLACAVEIGHVASVVDTPEMTPVPGTNEAVAGVARLRGEVTVVADLHAILGTDRRRVIEDRTVVLERGPDATPVAFPVDGVEQMVDVHVDGIAPADVAEVDPALFVAAADTEEGRVGVVGIDRLADLIDDAVR